MSLVTVTNIVEEIKGRGYGARVAIREGEREISFDDLFAAVAEVRGRLLACDVFRQKAVIPRIGVGFPNGLGYIVVALAVLEAGACFVPIPDELTECERADLMVATALHGVVRDDGEGGFDLPLGLGGACVESRGDVAARFPEDEFDALNPAFIRFSSGTTASSKGVVLSHQSLLERITAANGALKLAPGDVVLWTLPMAHHFVVSIVLYLYFGATTVIETSHQPDQVYRAARESGANLLYGSPFHFAQLAQCVEAKPLPELRLAVSTASALSDGVAVAFRERFHLPLTQALGIIEVGLPIMNCERAGELPTALGQVLPAYAWRSVPHGDDGVVGELMLRGPGMFDAYLVPWQLREEVSENGWFFTGDLVEEVVPGTLEMRGRSKSVINAGGMKVFPEEIEAVLDEYPLIIRSRVYAGHHPTLGSFPIAEIVCGDEVPTSLEVREFCETRLAAYKIPLQVNVVESVPLTASGKVKRHG